MKGPRDRTAFESHYGCMTHSSVSEVLDDDALRRRVAALERAVACTRRADRWRMVLPAVLAAAVLPALAWSASVPHPGFQAGDVISASEINANFSALVEQVGALESQAAGPIVMSQGSGIFSTGSDTNEVIPNNQVQIETRGGVVRVELGAVPTLDARMWLSGNGEGADPWLFAYVVFERSVDALQWEAVAFNDFGGVPGPVGSTAIPPGGFVLYDEPAAGEWFYRASVRVYSGAGPSTVVHIDNVRLIAREIGAAP